MDIEQFVYKEHIAQELEFSKVYRYLDRYVREDIFTITDIKGKKAVRPNRTVWLFWMQGMENAPALIRKCCKSVQKHIPAGYDIVLLTEKNLREYVQLPEYIWKKYRQGYITTTHLSDIVRIELLCTYGGCWIDATVFCSGPIPECMLSGDLFLFKDTLMSRTVIKMSSWWMYADQKNRLIHAARNLLYSFWENETDIRNYYILHIIICKLAEEDTACRACFQRIPYFNNSTPHILYGRMGWEFNEKDWLILKNSTMVHKLSYKHKFLQGDIDNYYQALLEGKLG